MIATPKLKAKIKTLLPNNGTVQAVNIKNILLDIISKTDKDISNIPSGSSSTILKQAKHPTTLNVGEYYYNTDLKKILFLEEKHPWEKPKYKISSLMTDLVEKPFKYRVTFTSEIRRPFVFSIEGNMSETIFPTDTFEQVVSKISNLNYGYSNYIVESYNENSFVLTSTQNSSCILLTEVTENNIYSTLNKPFFQEAVDYTIEIIDRGYKYCTTAIYTFASNTDFTNATTQFSMDFSNISFSTLNEFFLAIKSAYENRVIDNLNNNRSYILTVDGDNLFFEGDELGPEFFITSRSDGLSNGGLFLKCEVVNVGGDIWKDLSGSVIYNHKYYNL